ncbi:MAG: hypothetical protein RJA70_1642 [Pseudomonadota bacterium]|jgi:hypothetical protein
MNKRVLCLCGLLMIGLGFTESSPSVAAISTSTLDTPPLWVLKKPGPSTQVKVTVAQRGINPCLTPDPGFPGYSSWDRAPSLGQMIVPNDLRVDRKGNFDLVIHFHGHEAARKEWVRAADGVVMAGIDLGNGSGAYEDKFADPAAFPRLVKSIEDGVAKRMNLSRAKARRVALTSWSAGYGATLRILGTTFGKRRVDAVVLLDGLHTGYFGGGIDTSKLRPFVDFARSAAASQKLMVISHSSIIPPGYASTTETAQYLAWAVGGKPEVSKHQEAYRLGLNEISRYSTGSFHVRGFSGNEALDHCAQFEMLGYAAREFLASRWGFLPVSGNPAAQVTASR